MPETIIQSVLTGTLPLDVLVRWLSVDSEETTPEDCEAFCCSRKEFVAYFLTFLRNQTDGILKPKSSHIQHQSTPNKIINSKRKNKNSISEPTSELENERNESLTVKHERRRSQSPHQDRNTKKTTRKVKTKLFHESSQSLNSPKTDSDDSRHSLVTDRLGISSTPLKNGMKPAEYQNLSTASPVTPSPRSVSTKEGHERCDTPRTGRHSRSDKLFNLGDYIVATGKSKDKKKKVSPKMVSNVSDASISKTSLDISNSDVFPEIGSRKSSSLKMEKRRIKPTNIDCTPQKSLSMNSFNSDAFQQPSPLALEDNLAFSQQKVQLKESENSFDAERNILKQERYKLMEKFNVLNISNSPKSPITPTIKIMRRDSFENDNNFVKVEPNKVTYKEKIDLLVNIYEILMKNNYVLSVNSEIYFLISILLSKQYEDDLKDVETKITESNFFDFILKSIHNSLYFSVKSLWVQRYVLEIILDKNTLKLLGENRHLRSFYPDLAKFLLNLYGLKCDSESQTRDEKSTSIFSNRLANGMVCFNLETDNADNFPSVLSFHNFKKQRDMFYEILRWYNESQPSGAAKSTFRARVKTLLSLAVAPDNHAHLARLYTTHMMAECLPCNEQESKLSKLQRRLTDPATQSSHRLPSFTSKETFYKEFVIYAENEMFRVHLKDCLASEICSLNDAPIGNTDDRGASSEITKDYLSISLKLRLLSKMLGLVSDLPYSTVPIDHTLKSGVWVAGKAARSKVESHAWTRERTQPIIDLKGIVIECIDKGRLSVTIPWLVHYLSMLYFTTLRTKYYQELITTLLDIYTQKLLIKNENSTINKNTKIYLKLLMGWLFDLPEFPQEIFYESCHRNKMADCVASEENVDSILVVDESIITVMCPFLKDINVLLSSTKPIQDVKDVCTFRHITPVTILNPEERVRNKEKEIQASLAEALLKSQPSSTRRVIELVIERVTSTCIKQITSLVNDYRGKSWNMVVEAASKNNEPTELLTTMKSIYNNQLKRLQSEANETAKKTILNRTSSALHSLLPPGNNRQPLEMVASKSATGNVQRWINQHVNSTAILCKDIEEEMKNLLVTSDSLQQMNDSNNKSMNNNNNNKNNLLLESLLLPSEEFERICVSPAGVIIEVKEQICLLLDNESTCDLSQLLSTCKLAVSSDNILCTSNVRGVICTLVATLCLVVVARKPKDLDESFLQKCHSIWDVCCPNRVKNTHNESLDTDYRTDISPELRNFDTTDERAPTPISDDEIQKTPIKFIVKTDTDLPKKDDSTTNRCSKNDTTFNSSKSYDSSKNKSLNNDTRVDETDSVIDHFNRVLCTRNIVLLSQSKCTQSVVWETLANFLVFLLRNDYLSEGSLTEQCLAVYRQEWPKVVLENLALCMKLVSTRWRISGGKFNLFLDFLSEFCGDMDYESFDMG